MTLNLRQGGKLTRENGGRSAIDANVAIGCTVNSSLDTDQTKESTHYSKLPLY